MTAIELLAAVKSLDKLSGDLLSVLAISCEKCVGCEDECPFSQESRDIRLPKYLLEAAEIPVGASLCAEPDPDTGRIIVSALEPQYDLSRVPEELLDALFECDVCLGSLSELLGRPDSSLASQTRWCRSRGSCAQRFLVAGMVFSPFR